MNVVEKTGTNLRPNAVDFERFRLRRFIESLGGIDELDTRSEPVDLAGIAEVMEGNQKAVLFRAAGPEKAELVGNVMGGRARIAAAFGVKPNELMKEVQRRLRNKPEIFEVSRAEAPCQEVVLTGADADLTRLPVHLQHGADGGPYISASIDYVIDPKTGFTNVGLAPADAALASTKPASISSRRAICKAIYLANAAAGKPTPVSFVVGAHPIDHVAGAMRLPVDELGIVASLRDAPLPVVKCITNDIRVPADAEYVIEGYLDEKGHREPEGPYGEFLGYYGAVKRNPVFHVTAITRRNDALFQTSTIGGKTLGRTDTAQLSALRTEVAIWRALRGGGARAGRGLCHDVERRRVQRARRAPPARAGRGAQRHRRLHGRARQLQERLRGRSRHRHLLRRADGLGDGDALPARPRPDRDERHAHPAARSVAAAGQPDRRQGRLRPDLAVRAGRRGSKAACRRRRRSPASASPRSRRRSPTGRSSSRS